MMFSVIPVVHDYAWLNDRAEKYVEATCRLICEPLRVLTMATSAFLFLGRTVVSLGASGATDCGCVSSLQQQQHNKKT